MTSWVLQTLLTHLILHTWYAYVCFENFVLHVWFANCVFLQIQVTHVFVLQPLLGHLVWGEPAM